MRFERPDKCPLCEDDDRSLFGNIELSEGEKRISGLENIDYDICKCGMIFHAQMMDAETSRKLYRDMYRASRPLGKLNISQENIQEERTRAKRVAKHLQGYLENIDSYLDVGSSTGSLLSELQEVYDCETMGVEPNRIFSEYVRSLGIDVVGDIKYVRGKFDLITIIHVLEHLQKPMEMLEKAGELLSKNGILAVEVPIMRKEGTDFVYNYNISHSIAFTRTTFFSMIKKSGFELLEAFEGEHMLVFARKVI